ncbi:MAG: S4 domain-containing protein, partial [Rhizobiaceae bacterium]|nr:S4 domain-containing protein [Rhizobiaceae bacterium]
MARSAKGGTGNRVTITRALSKLGYCSRTQAERLLAEGRISVAGKPVTDFGTWVDIRSDRIEVDGRAVAAEEKVYVMLNKPRGLVTTRDDPEGRETVFSRLEGTGFGFLSP